MLEREEESRNKLSISPEKRLTNWKGINLAQGVNGNTLKCSKHIFHSHLQQQKEHWHTVNMNVSVQSVCCDCPIPNTVSRSFQLSETEVCAVISSGFLIIFT